MGQQTIFFHNISSKYTCALKKKKLFFTHQGFLVNPVFCFASSHSTVDFKNPARKPLQGVHSNHWTHLTETLEKFHLGDEDQECSTLFTGGLF